IDKAQPVPAYTLEKVLDEKRSSEVSQDNMPHKAYDFFMAFKQGGKVRLGRSCLDGPETEPRRWPKGMVFGGGLVENSVVAGWLAASENLLLVAWTEEPHSWGNSGVWYHSYVIVHLAADKATVLLRRTGAITGRARHMSYDWGMDTYHYEYDPKTKTLTERLQRRTLLFSEAPRPLYYPGWLDEGTEGYIARIRETVLLKYAYGEGTLKLTSIKLFYKTQKRDMAKDVAKFYLGPVVPVDLVVRANSDVRAEAGKPIHPWCYLLPDTLLEIPVPTDWLMARYSPRMRGDSN
ncbi:MAG: hypothetical protein ACYTF6_12160, partial [Planctomycetota bacterium]